MLWNAMSDAWTYRILGASVSTRTVSQLLSTLLLITCFAGDLFAQPVMEIDRHSRNQLAGQHVFYFEDTNQSLGIEDVRRLSARSWEQSQDASPSFGISNSQYWFSVTLENVDKWDQEFVALVDYTALDELEFFLIDPSTNNIIEYVKTGDRHPFSTRPIEHLSFAFPFDLKANASAQIFLRAKSGGNIAVPLSISEKSSFFRDQKNHFMLYGLITGIMIITGLYNLFVFFRTREKVFFAFSLFVFSVAILFTNQSGLAYLYLWPNAVDWNEVCVLATICFITASHCYFSHHFLSIHPILSRAFFTLIGLSAIVPLLYPFLSYSTLLSTGLLIAIVGLVFSATVAFTYIAKGSRAARVYALAWSPFFLGALLASSIRFGIVPFSFMFEHAAFFGSLTTVVVFSMAIADRINTEKQSRINAQNLAIESLEKYETLFKESIEGIYIFTVNGKLISANPSFLRMIGYSDVDEYASLVLEDVSKLYVEKGEYEKIVAELETNSRVVDREVEVRRKNGTTFWASTSMRLSNKLRDGFRYVEGTLIDISERKESERKLAYLATHDPLTNLINRRQFEVILQTAADHTTTHHAHHTMLYMDLDQFKIVNDTCGHTAGDHLLKQLTKILMNALGQRGVLARLGGDEFGVLISKSSDEGAYKIAEHLCEVVQQYRFVWEKRVFNLGVSIGLVELTQNLDSVEDIMRLADTACYAAKDAGRNRIHTYSADNVELELRRSEMELVSAINTSIAKNNFHLVRQRIASSQNEEQTIGYEILVRASDADGNYVAPSKFIPAAERYNIMPLIDRWVTKHTFCWLSDNPEELDKVQHYAINLSGQSLNEEKFKAYLLDLFAKYDVPYNKICFEVTETAAIQNMHETNSFIESLRDKGCRFALDDFGTGFSSYGYLKNLPVDHLKIDGEFIRNIEHDNVDVAMVKSICSIAEAMGKKTTAEFVENPKIAEHLKVVGVDFLQGYHIGKPEPIALSCDDTVAKDNTFQA